MSIVVRDAWLAARFWKRGWARFTAMDFVFKAAVTILTIMLLTAALSSLTGFAGSTSATVGSRLMPPSGELLLGTDPLGRSLLPRLLEGVGTTLLLSLIAVVLSATISTVFGLIAGYCGGAANEMVMRVVDIVYAFPALILAIMVSAMLGPGRTAALLSITLITIPLMTRMVRATTQQIRNRDFVTAAQISGVRTPRIFISHLLPNIAGTIAVQGSYALSIAILVEGGLSFLGYGVQVPNASLGLLIQDGLPYITTAPWLLFAPAAVVVVAILSVNLIGDGLRDVFDPREVRSLT